MSGEASRPGDERRSEPSAEHQEQPFVTHDKRKLDPETGAARPEAETGEARPTAETAGAFEAPAGSDREAELLADLQRVTAEYSNYRKRTERDRAAVVETATLRLLEALLPVLDSIELARQHGDLEGAFKGVGEALEQVVERQGLERIGKKGDPFDPAIHHALVHVPDSPDVDFPVVAEVLQPGWRLTSGRVLRAAGVAVAEPPEVAAPETPAGDPQE